MKHLKLTLFILAASVSGVWAQSVDTVAVWSQSMKKNVKNVVITPANYKTAKNERFPVVYLLHGAGGNYSNWIKKTPFLPELASRYGMIIVRYGRFPRRTRHNRPFDGRSGSSFPCIPPPGPLRGMRFDIRRRGHPVFPVELVHGAETWLAG